MTPAEILSLPAGAELDAIVATYVMGWRFVGLYLNAKCYEPPGFQLGRQLPHSTAGDPFPAMPAWSTDIVQAWKVVERMEMFGLRLVLHAPGTGEWSDQALDYICSDRWLAEFRQAGHDSGFGGDGSTAPLAIVRAALMATLLRTPTPTPAA